MIFPSPGRTPGRLRPENVPVPIDPLRGLIRTSRAAWRTNQVALFKWLLSRGLRCSFWARQAGGCITGSPGLHHAGRRGVGRAGETAKRRRGSGDPPAREMRRHGREFPDTQGVAAARGDRSRQRDLPQLPSDRLRWATSHSPHRGARTRGDYCSARQAQLRRARQDSYSLPGPSQDPLFPGRFPHEVILEQDGRRRPAGATASTTSRTSSRCSPRQGSRPC
jgi:hypothetical protein